LTNDKLNFVEASFLVVIVMITHIISDLPNDIIKAMGSASILNMIFISALILLFFLIVAKIFSCFNTNNILYVAEYLGGKFLVTLLSIIYIAYLLFVSALLIRRFASLLKIIYFKDAATWTIIACFILVALITLKLGSSNIIKANTLIMPTILITIVIIFISSINKFDFASIFPILGYGSKNTFLNGFENIYAFTGLIYLYLIGPNLKNVKDYTRVGVTSIIISAIYLILSVASIQMLFPFISNDSEPLSMYLSTRTIEFGQFFQRSDAIFMFIWIFTFLSYLSVIGIYISRIGIHTFGSMQNSISPYFYAIIVFIIALIPRNASQIAFLTDVVYKYLAIGVVFVFSFLILLLGFIKKMLTSAIYKT
jgi:spore germination protein